MFNLGLDSGALGNVESLPGRERCELSNAVDLEAGSQSAVQTVR